MRIWEIFLTGLSLSADACAVAMCKGVEMKKFVWKYALLIALCFGLFQALMPLIGWAVASQFAEYITAADHWIAFILLAFLGIRMFAEGIESEKELRESKKRRTEPSPILIAHPPRVTLLPARAEKLELGVKTLLVMSWTFGLRSPSSASPPSSFPSSVCSLAQKRAADSAARRNSRAECSSSS